MDSGPDDALAGFAAEAAVAAVDRREAALGHLSGLAVLADADFDRLGDVGRVDALIELQRAQAWLDSLQVELMAAVAGHDQTPEQWSRHEVAAALRLSDVTAAVRLADAALIAEHLPLTLSALREGGHRRPRPGVRRRGGGPARGPAGRAGAPGAAQSGVPDPGPAAAVAAPGRAAAGPPRR